MSKFGRSKVLFCSKINLPKLIESKKIVMELSTKLNGFTMINQNMTYLEHPLIVKSPTSKQPGVRYFAEVCNFDEYSESPG